MGENKRIMIANARGHEMEEIVKGDGEPEMDYYRSVSGRKSEYEPTLKLRSYDAWEHKEFAFNSTSERRTWPWGKTEAETQIVHRTCTLKIGHVIKVERGGAEAIDCVLPLH